MRATIMVVGLVGACATASEVEHPSLPVAVEAAAEQHRPLIVELSATWCKPCRIFAEQVLTDPRVREALRDVVFVSYDVDTAAGRDAVRRTRERAVPTVLGIDHDGRVRLRKVGTEPNADEFLNFMRQAHAALAR